ncbi:MAG: DUF342 domain-containing protein [Nitrospirae bacterium]|nr:MAG: DUF342 domain-containing protein [Nitrospirota bacterium]
MKRVLLKDLKPGMIVGTDIYEPGKGMFPLVTEGFVLDKETIFRLRSKDLSYVLIQVPRGYRGVPGEVFELYQLKEDIDFEGRVEVHSGVQPGIKIKAGETIVVSCDVVEGCSLENLTGNISIKGSILGTAENPVRIHTMGDVTIQGTSANKIYFAEIKASGEVTTALDVSNSSITSAGDVTLKGSVTSVDIVSESRINIRNCVAGENTDCCCSVTVNPIDHLALIKKLEALDVRIAKFEKAKDGLQNIAATIKKLGPAIYNVPADKKRDLLAGQRKLKELEEELEYLLRDKEELKREIDLSLAVKRISITGDIFPGTRVCIENKCMSIEKKERSLSFLIKNSQIISVPYGS